MNETRKRTRTVRIALLLGGAETSRPALQLLTQLAWKKSVQALGIFIEDSTLLTLAQMPFSRELCRVTFTERPLEKADIERQLRIQARGAQLAFENAATEAGIVHSFRTMRGAMAALLQQAAQEMDLMILGPARRQRQFSEPISLSAIARLSRLPVMALFDGSESSLRALDAAKQLAETGNRRLTVLISADNGEASLVRQQQAAEALGDYAASYRFAVNCDIETLLQTGHNEKAGTLVLGVSEALLQPQFLEELSHRLEIPALLVR
ncbi:MAG: universal stress protein [Chromatiaceae bacterium]|nr:universal stress protein [Chromatiaceae bacterium]